MKIAVVGCGAVGSYYGARLASAGEALHFLLRSDYDVVSRQGLSVRSPLGDFTVRPHPALTPQQIGPCDLVLIALKTTANDQLPILLPPLVHAHTAVVTLQNGLGNEAQLARLVSSSQILGGLCFVCLNRIAPGVVHHIDHGQIILGEFDGPSRPRTAALADLFCRAGVPCQLTDNLAQAHWEKLTWNIPFNGLGVAGSAGFDAAIGGHLPPAFAHCHAGTLTTDILLADPRWAGLVRELISEVISAACAMGYRLPESLADKQIERTRSMGAYKASTLIDFERGHPLELESLFLEPLRQARTAGVRLPRLEALCSVLRQLDPANGATFHTEH